MKFPVAALAVASSAAALTPMQQVLQAPQLPLGHLSKPLHDLQASLKSLTAEARAVWDEVAMMFPEAMDKANFFSPPKKHKRRNDSQWDSITRGGDIQDMWVQGESGSKERAIDGRLETYNLRSKGVDPGALEVDPGVKQISGYLDDEENDKHLFYCKLRTRIHFHRHLLSICRVL